MTSWRILEGDCRDLLDTLEPGSVQTCVTSPPYFGLRDYGVDGQLGLEATPDEFVEAMVAVFREVRRVLRDDGTLWLNLGDSYSGGANSGGANSGTTNGPPVRIKNLPIKRGEGIKPKDLIGIPWAVAQALRAPDYHGRIGAERDRVWLAATLDAEGSICGFTHKRADDGTTRTGVHVTITNTNEALLGEADRIWPASRVEHENHGEGHYGYRPSWRWVAHGAEDKALLMRELFPYLIAKRAQARLAWAFFEMSKDAKRLARTAEAQEIKDRRAWIVGALSRLNRGEDVDVPSWVGVPPSVETTGWYLRSDIIWHKPNPMPESVTDRPTRAHEFLFLLSKSPRYFYGAEAIREDDSGKPAGNGYDRAARLSGGLADGNVERWEPGGGRNKRDVWTVTTQPFAGAHFATFPPKLIEPCILAGAPEGGVVLDPFAGAGTTGLVALRHNRSFVGCELNPEYAELARDRIRDDAPLLNTPSEVAA